MRIALGLFLGALRRIASSGNDTSQALTDESANNLTDESGNNLMSSGA